MTLGDMRDGTTKETDNDSGRKDSGGESAGGGVGEGVEGKGGGVEGGDKGGKGEGVGRGHTEKRRRAMTLEDLYAGVLLAIVIAMLALI